MNILLSMGAVFIWFKLFALTIFLFAGKIQGEIPDAMYPAMVACLIFWTYGMYLLFNEFWNARKRKKHYQKLNKPA